MAAKKPSMKARAWCGFDRITADAAPHGEYSNPWYHEDGRLRYRPDFETLRRLLAVPLFLGAGSTSGVPALALDVWVSYELRRAGFDPDVTWPRATPPRVLPRQVATFIEQLSPEQQEQIRRRIEVEASVAGVTSSSASILGKNYLKQVDVLISDWQTGPELLISTKRMDSSFGKNAANRVEEAYGDVKNLRLRHPLAAHGFVFGLRSTILQESPDTAEWLMDLMAKLSNEEDAYHATCVLLIDYDQPRDAHGGDEPPAATHADDAAVTVPERELEQMLASLPDVSLMEDAVPAALAPARFLDVIVNHVLDAAPITMHAQARQRRKEAMPESSVGMLGSAHDVDAENGAPRRC